MIYFINTITVIYYIDITNKSLTSGGIAITNLEAIVGITKGLWYYLQIVEKLSNLDFLEDTYRTCNCNYYIK